MQNYASRADVTLMKLYFLLNGRLPSKKAFGIQAAKMCEAFIEEGHDVTLVIPRTADTRQVPIRDFYRLRVDVPVAIIPGPDWYGRGRLLFLFGSFFFMVRALRYLRREEREGRRGLIYAIDTDSLSFFSLTRSPFEYLLEIDKMPSLPWLTGRALTQALGIVAINEEVRTDLMRRFNVPSAHVLASLNGVDPDQFTPMTKQAARRLLSLPIDQPFALYAGRFHDYKGLETLIAAGRLLGPIPCLVLGGSEEEFKRAMNIASVPEGLRIVGECKSYEVPVWLAAADALVVVGGRKNTLSARYFSPMKVLEYMAAHRPIVASDVPAIRAILREEEAVWYEADDGAALARAIEQTVGGGSRMAAIADRALQSARTRTWRSRARGIADFIARRSTL